MSHQSVGRLDAALLGSLVAWPAVVWTSGDAPAGRLVRVVALAGDERPPAAAREGTDGFRGCRCRSPMGGRKTRATVRDTGTLHGHWNRPLCLSLSRNAISGPIQ